VLKTAFSSFFFGFFGALIFCADLRLNFCWKSKNGGTTITSKLGVMYVKLPIHHIREKAKRDGQKKNEETITR
jgi:hypothetical protein